MARAVAKARYVLNLYSAGLPATDTHPPRPRSAVLADLTRLSREEPEQDDVRPKELHISSSRPDRIERRQNRKHLIKILARHVKTEESLLSRGGSGWLLNQGQ